MHFAVCAQREVRQDILEMLHRMCTQRSVSYSLRQYKTPRELLYDVQDGERLTMVFLEIEQDLSALRDLREAGYDGGVILLSTCADFAVAAYAYRVADYWLLPLDADVLYPRLQALTAFAYPACLTVKCHGAIVRVPYTAIVFAESRNAKCLIHRANEEDLVVYCKLDDIERRLTDERFLRCHQSYLVNMDHVVGAERHFLLDDGRSAAIRQRELRRIRERYMAYVQRRQASWQESKTDEVSAD